MMTTTVNQRLAEFIAFLGLPKADFAATIGATRQQLDNWINGGVKIPVTYLSAICKRYPNLNARWLLCGDGKMIMEDDNVTIQHSHTSKLNPEFLDMIYNEQLKYAEVLMELSELKVKYFNLLGKVSREKENNHSNHKEN